MQFEFPGTSEVPDGRYLVRHGDGSDAQAVLAVDTLGAPSPPARRRRSRRSLPAADRPFLPLAQVTVIHTSEPFDSADEAGRWLSGSIEADETVEALVDEGIGLLNRALHAHAVVSANPRGQELAPQQAVLVRIGYGSGEELAAGRFSVAHDIDVTAVGRSRRKRREADLRPQERLAAVLGSRERLDACEPLVLRARADLDGGRLREAALQLRVALDALLAELAGALVDPAHDRDMATLQSRRDEAKAASEMALHGDLDEKRASEVRELIEICERVLRRRRVLRG